MVVCAQAAGPTISNLQGEGNADTRMVKVWFNYDDQGRTPKEVVYRYYVRAKTYTNPDRWEPVGGGYIKADFTTEETEGGAKLVRFSAALSSIWVIRWEDVTVQVTAQDGTKIKSVLPRIECQTQ